MNKLSTFFRESSTARFLIPLGLIIIIFGISIFIINEKNKDYIETEAVVSKTELIEEAHTDSDGNTVDAVYKVYVDYFADNKKYTSELGELSNIKKDQRLTIYYNPQNPSDITQTKNLILPIVLLLSGIVALTSGIISGLNAIKKFKKMKEQEKGWKNE